MEKWWNNYSTISFKLFCIVAGNVRNNCWCSFMVQCWRNFSQLTYECAFRAAIISLPTPHLLLLSGAEAGWGPKYVAAWTMKSTLFLTLPWNPVVKSNTLPIIHALLLVRKSITLPFVFVSCQRHPSVEHLYCTVMFVKSHSTPPQKCYLFVKSIWMSRLEGSLELFHAASCRDEFLFCSHSIFCL